MYNFQLPLLLHLQLSHDRTMSSRVKMSIIPPWFIHTLLFTRHHSYFSLTRTSCLFNSTVSFPLSYPPCCGGRESTSTGPDKLSLLCIRLCVISFYTVAPCIKACLKAFHTGCHVPLSDSLARQDRQREKERAEVWGAKKKRKKKKGRVEVRAILTVQPRPPSSGADQM